MDIRKYYKPIVTGDYDFFSKNDLENEKVLGEGAFGVVHMVKDKRNDKRYALKTYKVKHYNLAETGVSGSFTDISGTNRQEIDFLRRSNHPNIIRGLGAFLTESSIVKKSKKTVKIIDLNLVMELADTSLLEYLRNEVSNEEKINLCYHALCGLNFMHENGYLHCDLKPDNMLVLNRVAKLSDPGHMLNKNAVEDTISVDAFCNSVLTRAPEFVAPFYPGGFPIIVDLIKSFEEEYQRNEARAWIASYNRMLKKTSFYENLSNIAIEGIINRFSVKSLQIGEIFSFGMLMLDIYISPLDLENELASWLYILYHISILPYDERLEALRGLEIWPKGERNMPELDRLLATILAGNPDERKFTLLDILNFKVFKDHGYTTFVKGTLNNAVQNISRSCTNITEPVFLPTMSDMAYVASNNNMYMYNLAVAYALFHKMLQDITPGNTTEKVSAAGAISLFLSIGRNDHMMKGATIATIYASFRSRRAIPEYSVFIDMLKETYTTFNGIITYENTFDYACTGNVDAMSLRYYTECIFIQEYTPAQYVTEMERIYQEIRSAKDNDEMVILAKNSLVKDSYRKISRYFIRK
jgi:serine/threonine protein kinase